MHPLANLSLSDISPLVFMGSMTIELPSEIEVTKDGMKKRVVPVLVGAFILVLFVIFVVEWVIDSQDGLSKTFSPRTELIDMNGDLFDFSELEGTPLVINFFASWCAPCQREMRAIEEISGLWDERVTFIGVNSQETDVEQAKNLIEETGASYTILFGGDGNLLEEVGAVGLPFTLFVNPDRSIAGRYLTDLNKDELVNYLEKFFN
jgi:thiol-disulfide isomerase/thioredoxin